MSAIDLQHLRQWIGRETLVSDTLSVRHARLMAATHPYPRYGTGFTFSKDYRLPS
jgi:3-methylfumaryl-CoA hydratase